MIAAIAAAVLAVAAIGGGLWWRARHQAPPSAPEVAVAQPEPAAPTPAPEAAPPAPETPPPDTALTNDSIIEMVNAKVAPNVILSQIRTAPKTNFNLSQSEVIRLSKAGVPESVIETMRDPKKVVAANLPPPVPAAKPPVAGKGSDKSAKQGVPEPAATSPKETAKSGGSATTP